VNYVLDTSILLARIDGRDPEKTARAEAVLANVVARQTAAIPAQVLGEYARNALRFGVPPATVYSDLEDYATALPVLPLTAPITLEAVRGVQQHKLAYFDAQIWACAKLNQVPIILSQDFNIGATLEGVTFLDPFAAGFVFDT
jgi:predicted nucleic acid-binding protein